jgi:hypothetical protein
MIRALSLAAAAALLFAALPAGAASHGEASGPCGDREIPLADGETLVQRTLFFHGSAPVGNVDGAQDSRDGGASRLFMDATAPTVADHKVYASRPAGAIGAPAFAQNQFLGYWIHGLEAEQRVVCAQATVFAATATGNLPVQLWVDAPRGLGAPTVTASGKATANQASKYVVNFGALDVEAFDSLLVQLVPDAPGALAYYDSTGRPSSFTYMTVEPAPAT